MKTALLFLALCATVMADTTTSSHHHGHHNFEHGGELDHVIRKEVHQLLQRYPDLTLDTCTEKCDALFALLSDHNEHGTDRLCHHQCRRALHGGHHDDTTTSMA